MRNTILKKFKNDTGRMVYVPKTEKRLDLALGRLYTGMTLAFEMTYTIPAGAVPSGRVFGQAMAIIENLKIKINDSERLIPVNLSGMGIIAQHLNDTGVSPTGFVFLQNQGGTFTVKMNVPVTFGCPSILLGTGVGIDLTADAAVPNLFKKAEIIVKFGDENSLYEQPEGTVIDSCTIDFITQELDVSQKVSHVRYPLRYLEDKLVPVVNSEPTEILLRKTTNTQMVGVSMIALRNGFLSDFDQTANMSVKHGDEVIVDDMPASVLHEIASAARAADYDEGYIRYDFANYGLLETVPDGLNLDNDITFTMPTVFTTQDDRVLVVNETLKKWDFG